MITNILMPIFVLGAFTVFTEAPNAARATRVVPADRDTTLIEETDGGAANGAGPALFAGKIASGDNTLRRALLRFDLTTAPGTLPKRPVATAIESVTLVLTVITEPPEAPPREFRLHRLLADWGEGTSSSPGGTGAAATPGDATWVHSYYPDAFWMHNGAQFDGEPSARPRYRRAGRLPLRG
jgi:hypothetical protein